MRSVANILSRKGSGVTVVSPNTPVIQALEIMAKENIGSVVVMEEATYLGIVTERDYSRKVILKGKNSAQTTVAEIMTTNLPEVQMNTKVDECMKLLSAHNVRYLPVIEHKKLVGIVSINDVVKETILQQQETIQHLESYIQS